MYYSNSLNEFHLSSRNLPGQEISHRKYKLMRFEGIIFVIKVVYGLEVLVQIDTACTRVYKLDLSSSSQQLGPHFPYVPCTTVEVMTFMFIKGHC